jgi:hypothetical protein
MSDEPDWLAHDIERAQARLKEWGNVNDADSGTAEAIARAWDPVGWDWYDRNADNENAATQRSRAMFLADQTKRAAAVMEALKLT